MSEYRDAQLKRIADALERIACAQEGRRVIQDMVHSPTTALPTPACPGPAKEDTSAYEKAAAALKAMPDDIPPEPATKAEIEKADVVAALNQYSRVHGVPAAKKVLASFAASGQLADVPEDKWPDLVGILKGGA